MFLGQSITKAKRGKSVFTVVCMLDVCCVWCFLLGAWTTSLLDGLDVLIVPCMDLLDFDRGGGFVGTFGEIETRKKLEEGMTLLPPFLVCVWKGGTFGVPYVRTVRARYSSSVCGSACRTVLYN